MRANYWSPRRGRTVKSVFIVVFGFSLVLLTLLVIDHQVIQPTFRSLEEEQAFEDNERIHSSIVDELKGLSNLANDWANWDETYSFAQHPTPTFIEANCPDAASLSQNSNIDLLAIFNRQGQSQLLGAFHPSIGQDVQLGLFEGATPPVLKIFSLVLDREIPSDGLLNTEHGLLLIVARPIFSSLKKGPSQGMLLMGRFLTDSRIKTLSERAKVSVRFIPYQSFTTPQQPLAKISDNPISLQGVQVNRIIFDIEEKPLVVMQTPVRGRIVTLGAKTGRSLSALLSLIAFFLLVCLAMYRSRMKKTQYNLEERESLYRQLFEAESDAIFLVDNVTGQILEANSAASCLYGYNHEELLTKINTDLSAEPKENLRITRDSTPVVEDQIVNIPLEFHRKNNGTIFPVEITGRIFNHNGRSVRLVAVRDITERKRIEDQLRFTQFAVDHSADGAFWVNKDGRLFYVNQEGCRSLGYTELELQKMTIEDIDPAFSFELWPEYWEELKAKKNILLESQHKTKDGKIFPIEISANYVEFNGNEYNCAIVRDISLRRQMEKERTELEAINWQLQKEESLSRMAGAIAHHFNNKLMGIMGILELALDGLDTRKNDYIEKALKHTEKAAGLSRLMLTYLGQTQNSSLTIQDLSKTCKSYTPVIQAIIPHNVDLKMKFKTPGPMVKINVEHLLHILTNLVTNGVEALEHKSGSIELMASTIRQEDLPKSTSHFPVTWQSSSKSYACLAVTDNGCGIALENIEKLFDPFFTSKFVGRGLGLPVVLGLVKVHGGMITVTSKQDEGSIFRVYFPIHDPVT